jgi:hypothetical protein
MIKKGFEEIDTSIKACAPIYPVLKINPKHDWFLKGIVKFTRDECIQKTGKDVMSFCDPWTIITSMSSQKRAALAPFFVVIAVDFSSFHNIY